MKITLRKLLLALLLAGVAPLASAISLGEGQILSHIGESFSANIALLGGNNRDVSFYQVKSAECRSSIIANSASGCDSLYEGRLIFAIKRRADGQYYLRVTGEKSDEMFYRIIIKSVAAGGTSFNTFEFLPEFSASSASVAPALNESDITVNAGFPFGKQGVIVDVSQDEAGKALAPVKNAGGISPPVKTLLRDESQLHAKHKAAFHPVKLDEKSAVKLTSDSRLQIKKTGEYADDIQALQKENGEIEEQIVLLEKHIGLLKDVIRLKNQISVSGVLEAGVSSAVGVSASAAAPVLAPVVIQSVQGKSSNETRLTWILLGVILALSAVLGWMYVRLMRAKSTAAAEVSKQMTLTPASLNEMKPLDLTDSFAKPGW
jgi:hypothetical protein